MHQTVYKFKYKFRIKFFTDITYVNKQYLNSAYFFVRYFFWIQFFSEGTSPRCHRSFVAFTEVIYVPTIMAKAAETGAVKQTSMIWLETPSTISTTHRFFQVPINKQQLGELQGDCRWWGSNPGCRDSCSPACTALYIPLDQNRNVCT